MAFAGVEDEKERVCRARRLRRSMQVEVWGLLGWREDIGSWEGEMGMEEGKGRPGHGCLSY